jgi:dephospho-CoA kinase
MKVILISGKQGSGKTSLRNYLFQRLPDAKCVSFADPLRYIVEGIRTGMVETGLKFPEHFAMRSLLQFLGTEWGREQLNLDIWLEAAKRTIEALSEDGVTKYVLVDDLRFRNEFLAFPDATKIRLHCPDDIRFPRTKFGAETAEKSDRHISETDLDGFASMGLFSVVLDTGRPKKTVQYEIDSYIIPNFCI